MAARVLLIASIKWDLDVGGISDCCPGASFFFDHIRTFSSIARVSLSSIHRSMTYICILVIVNLLSIHGSMTT